LGEAFVRKACAAGANVFFTYFQNSAQNKALAKLGAKGFQVDLSNIEAVEKFAREFKESVTHLNALIHNAAAVRDHTIQKMSEEEWDYVLTADLKAPYYLTKKLLSLLFANNKEKKARQILFITSRVALRGGYGVSNYAAAKGGLIGLTKSLAMELGRKKILVNAINPGFMESKMTKDAPEVVRAINIERSLLKAYSDPEEVADFLVYLCSDYTNQVTGQVLSFESREI